jgi:Asp-tRNA(Asn)/Glu-tRNA(Gln) amidotransferase A subunit family amidase
MSSLPTAKLLTFSDMCERFASGADSPSAYLARCLATIEAREPVVRAWAATRFDRACVEAAASDRRWAEGKPLSSIDGMPIGIKDLISTGDLPTALGIKGYAGKTGDDSATIQALKAAGAIIMGKVTTTELGGGTPSVTTNPFDPARTPGGSSCGSAAAVAAGMIPVALGTQVGGSILRPAAFCGNIALKPTLGAFHRGERLGLSHACIGVHANSIDDLWATSVEMGMRCGGDPGYPGLYGALPAPLAAKPRALAVMEGPGWDLTGAGARAAFSGLLARLESAGVTVVRSGDDARLDDFHRILPDTMRAVGVIVTWENRALLNTLTASIGEKLSVETRRQYEYGLTLAIDDYRRALDLREELRRRQVRLAGLCDGLLSLSAPGIAPLIDDPNRAPGEMATGNPVYNVVPSLLGAPALTMPLLRLEGMPLGVQLVGQWHADAQIVANGRWMIQHCSES